MNISTIRRLLNHPTRIIPYILVRLGKYLPDEIFLRLKYYEVFGKKLNLKNPLTFNEKLQWLKLYDRKPEYTSMVDKIEVKKWVAERIGEQYVIPTIGVWKRAEDIVFGSLPDQFVLKTNHSGGNNGVFIVNDKLASNFENILERITVTLKYSIYDLYREWPYKNISKRIFAEEYLGDNIDDFKFFCYDGFVESVMYCTERRSGKTKYYFFDDRWRLKRYNIRGKEAPANFSIPVPKNIEKMFELASTLSKGLPFVRVDLYNIDGEIFFGEMTFYPASGLDVNLLPETDILFGSLIKLPIKQ